MKFTCVKKRKLGNSVNVCTKLQTMPLCNTIGLSSLCIATVESCEPADVPKVELGEQRVKCIVYYVTLFICIPTDLAQSQGLPQPAHLLERNEQCHPESEP